MVQIFADQGSRDQMAQKSRIAGEALEAPKVESLLLFQREKPRTQNKAKETPKYIDISIYVGNCSNWCVFTCVCLVL